MDTHELLPHLATVSNAVMNVGMQTPAHFPAFDSLVTNYPELELLGHMVIP